MVSSATQSGESGKAFTAYAIKVTGHDGSSWQVLRRFRCGCVPWLSLFGPMLPGVYSVLFQGQTMPQASTLCCMQQALPWMTVHWRPCRYHVPCLKLPVAGIPMLQLHAWSSSGCHRDVQALRTALKRAGAPLPPSWAQVGAARSVTGSSRWVLCRAPTEWVTARMNAVHHRVACCAGSLPERHAQASCRAGPCCCCMPGGCIGT